MDFDLTDEHISTKPFDRYVAERRKPLPSLNHGAVQANLIALLFAFKQYRIISELSLELSDWSSVPDLSIYPKQPLDFAKDVIKVKEAPLGVVEIISPTQSLQELTTKAHAYFAHGVQSCWLVLLPLTSVCVFSSPQQFTFFQDKDTLTDNRLGITLSLTDIFS